LQQILILYFAVKAVRRVPGLAAEPQRPRPPRPHTNGFVSAKHNFLKANKNDSTNFAITIYLK